MRPPTPSRISKGDTSLGPTNRITMSTALLPSVPRLARFVFPPLLLDALRLLDAATVPRVDSPHSPRVSPYICEGEPCHNSEGGPATPFSFAFLIPMPVCEGVLIYRKSGISLSALPDDGQTALPDDIQTALDIFIFTCLLYTSPSPRDATLSRMPSSA